jgi:hypothetical protein
MVMELMKFIVILSRIDPSEYTKHIMKVFFVFILGTSLFFSCGRNTKPDISEINLNFDIVRFDSLLFEMNQDSIDENITKLYSLYDDFFDVFSYYIISIGRPSSKDYSAYLKLFLNDPLNIEVYEEVKKKFPDLKDLNERFSESFKYFKYYFPEMETPQVLSYVSRFNNPVFTVGDYIGIGLDMYLGSDSEYYIQMNLPEYQRKNMVPEKITSEAIYNWVNAIFPFNDSTDNAVGHMIHYGKLMYFTEKLLPDQAENLLIGFDASQFNWCKENEERMWTYLIENKLLFSQDPLVIRKLTGVAPFTYYFTNMSPGRAGVWIGWQIVKEYARRNPSLSLSDIMKDTNYEEILRISRYDP